jgi:rhodanese-related sulfurtransferase
VIVCDAGDGRFAQRAADRLNELGYTCVFTLRGGVAAWMAQGLETFTGDSTLTKAFGEFVEQTYRTPHISARDLKSRLADNTDVVLLDGRTLPEFHAFSIPGAHACPNGELIYRVHELIRSDETLIVVNCAGRTRSIIGAQTLINAGIPNPVMALENGIMAWLFNGYELTNADDNVAPAPSGVHRAEACAAADRLVAKFGIERIDAATLQRFEAERDSRSLYLLDVRTRAEFEAGHLRSSQWAEGGQLVQGVDKWIATRHARIVLVDDASGVRAASAASWLVQIGWGEVFVLADDFKRVGVEKGPVRPPLWRDLPNSETLSPLALNAILNQPNCVVLDLASSLDYRSGHIPGACFAVRSRLAEQPALIPGTGEIVLTSPDGSLARLAAADLRNLTMRPLKVLAGGTNAWKTAALSIEIGDTRLLHEPDDIWRSPYEVDGERHAAFQDYIDWELELVRKVDRDPTFSFKPLPIR